MRKPIQLVAGVLGLVAAGTSAAQTISLGTTLGLPLGRPLGVTLGRLLGLPLGDVLPFAGSGILVVAAASLATGIYIVRRKRGR